MAKNNLQQQRQRPKSLKVLHNDVRFRAMTTGHDATMFYEHQYAQIDERGWQWRELGGMIKARNIAKIADGLAIQRVLDIGAGTGAVLAHLASSGLGTRYYALDISPSAMALVRRRVDIPPLVVAHVFDGSHIPYADQQFDLAILSHVIEHLDDPAPLLREAARVARYIAVEVPLEDTLYTRLRGRIGRVDHRAAIGHIQWFNQETFRTLLQNACGSVVRMQMVYLPRKVFVFGKRGRASRLKAEAQVAIRASIRAIAKNIYARSLTDHCIALVHSDGT